MELHQLRYFMAVVREGTFTRAAERLYITQPSLSEQIRKLETELGTLLFQRLGRRLALTGAGEAFLPHAEKVMFEVEQARARVREFSGLRRGRLSIGVLHSPAARLLPVFLAEFRRVHPGVELVLREEGVSADLEQLVHDGVLDLAIIRLPKRRPDLEVKLLVREPMVLVVPPGHRLSDRRSVALAELADGGTVLQAGRLRAARRVRDRAAGDRARARAGWPRHHGGAPHGGRPGGQANPGAGPPRPP